MLYTNYKQVARLVLKSIDAEQETTDRQFTVDTTTTNYPVVTKYTYNVNLPFYKFTKNTKLAVESFSYLSTNLEDKSVGIGDIFLLNIKKSNIYHSYIGARKGTCILSKNLSKSFEYINPDVINNSIDITGNTGFIEGNPLEIFVDTKIKDDISDINGCLEENFWSLTLVIYEEEKEENPKDYVDDKVKNYSKPSLY